MNKIGGSILFCAAIVLALALSATGTNIWLVAHGPCPPPDDLLVAHGPCPPPDDLLVAHGPCPPPDDLLVA